MIKTSFFTALLLSIFWFAACQQTHEPNAAVPEAGKTDLAKLKSEIQGLENAWAVASNAKDPATIAAFYADDALSFVNNKPIITGKAAIKADIEAEFANRKDSTAVVKYDVMDVYGDDNVVTEVGKTTVKDAAGKVIYNGKYMAIWEKRNGKWLVIRDIYNDDAKEK
jgi:uncharacterized protein (TIGR02246 family)